MNVFKTARPLSVLWAPFVLSACGTAAEEDSPLLEQAQEPVIFGNDDRFEYGAIAEPMHLRLADATAALFNSGFVSCGGGDCDLTTSPFTIGQVSGPDLPLCSGAPYAGQEQGAGCTAFLIGPDLFATAGHCLGCSGSFGNCSEAICENTSVVFGFNADENGNNEVTTVPDDDVYSCIGVPQGIDTDTAADYSVFRVDRVVTGRAPMMVRYTGSASVGLDVLVMGHPDGLPLKVGVDGEIKQNLGSSTFGTSLDAFGGNSGSPVMDALTGVVEGIHVRRPYWHYLASGSCATPNICSQSTGCSPNFGESAWAIATRFPPITSQVFVPLHSALVAAL